MGFAPPRRRQSRYQFAILVLDLIWSVAGMAIAAWLIPDHAPQLHRSLVWPFLLLLPALWCLFIYFAGQYYPRPWQAPYLTVLDMFKALALATAMAVAFTYAARPGVLAGRGFYFLSAFTVWFLGSVTRLIALAALPREKFGRRYVLLGLGRRAQAMAAAIGRAQARGERLVGCVALAGEAAGEGAPPVLGAPEDLPRLIDEHSLTNLVVCSDGDHRAAVARAMAECEMRGLRVESMPGAFERLTESAPIFAAGGEWVAGIETHPRTRYATRLKRLLDMAAALLLTPLAAALIPISAVAIKLTSPGPVFYTQTRVGRGGREFTFVKLRTMVDGAERETGPVWATLADPRVTPIGRLLRRLRLDELPQLWSVLRGEMSLIGPRPERPHFVEQFIERIPYYKLRLLVPPGISGWAQVHHGSDLTERDVYNKLRFDLYYVRHLSFALDLRIAGRTLAVIFGRQPTR